MSTSCSSSSSTQPHPHLRPHYSSCPYPTLVPIFPSPHPIQRSFGIPFPFAYCFHAFDTKSTDFNDGLLSKTPTLSCTYLDRSPPLQHHPIDYVPQLRRPSNSLETRHHLPLKANFSFTTIIHTMISIMTTDSGVGNSLRDILESPF